MIKKMLKAYSFPTIQLLGVIGITICSLWFSGWYSYGEKEYIDSISNSATNNQKSDITPVSFWAVTWSHAFSFKKPVPYTAISIFLAFSGGIGGFFNQHKINKYDELEEKYRTEKSSHGDTQKKYYEAIDYIIRSIFVSMNNCFDRDCRITIYRHTNDAHLQKIYRHAGQTRFENGGRLRIPDNEGAVGAAWLNEGIAHISLNAGVGTQTYNQQLERELASHGAKSPSSTTRMATRDYFAMAIRNSNGEKMAVIVLESMMQGKFDEANRKSLEETISSENGKIARYILDKGTLDKILNPDGALNHG